jgi:Zn-dependent peptidase ImmA (M78 family)
MRENPWRTLRARPGLTLAWRNLPTGMGGMWTPGVIVLDPRLDRVERRCVLMHELVHDERQIGWPFATAATMEREEAIVRSETADRLVPAAELLELVSLDGGEPVTAELVAAEFDVTIGVANLALRRLQGQLLEQARARAARPPSGRGHGAKMARSPDFGASRRVSDLPGDLPSDAA